MFKRFIIHYNDNIFVDILINIINYTRFLTLFLSSKYYLTKNIIFKEYNLIILQENLVRQAISRGGSRIFSRGGWFSEKFQSFFISIKMIFWFLSKY